MGPDVLRDVVGFRWAITFGCVTVIFDAKGGFSGSSYPMKTADFEVLKDVGTAKNFGTKVAITAFVSSCVNDSD